VKGASESAGQGSKLQDISDAACVSVVTQVFNGKKILSKMTNHFNVLKQNAEKFVNGRVLGAHPALYHNWEKS